MGNSGGIIDRTGGVRIYADIRAVLGATGKGLGELCTDSAVNPWAKCKPFAYAAWKFASDAARLAARRSRNCGLVMRDWGSLWSMYSNVVRAGAGAGGWRYDAPKGGASSPYRTLDWDGYDHGAGAPLQLGIFPNPCYKNGTPRLSDEGGAGTADITMADLLGDGSDALNHTNYKYHDISGLYIGVAYGTLTLSPDHAYTLGTVDNYSPQNIPAPGSSGSYNVVPFLSDKTFSGSAPSTSGIFIPCPAGLSIWNYYNYFPFQDRGTSQDQGALFVRLKVEVLQTIIYASLGVQFSSDGTTWGSTETIYSSSGTLDQGDMIQTNVIIHSGPTNPQYFRMVVNGTADTRAFTIQQVINA